MKKSDLLLEEFLPYRLSYLTNMISQDLAKLYTDRFGVTHTEWRVMAVLGISSGVSAAFVAEKTAMDKVAVSRAIKNMIKEGLVARNFADEDKRRSELTLTILGRDTYDMIVPLVQDYEKKLMTTLSRDEQKNIDALLSKLTEYVKNS